MKIFNAIARPTDYETAKMLADREDTINRSYTYPEMTCGYPKMKIKPSVGLYGFLQSILP